MTRCLIDKNPRPQKPHLRFSDKVLYAALLAIPHGLYIGMYTTGQAHIHWTFGVTTTNPWPPLEQPAVLLRDDEASVERLARALRHARPFTETTPETRTAKEPLVEGFHIDHPDDFEDAARAIIERLRR